MSSIQNPLMIGNKLMLPINSTHVELKVENVSKHFQHVFVLVKKNDNKINTNIFKKYIDNETLAILYDEFIIWKTPLHIIKNKNIFEKLSILNKETLQNFNHFNFELDENNLILPILNISFKNIISYLNNFDGISKLDKIYNILVISQYFNDDLSNIKNKMNLEVLIKNLDEANYWTMPYNCLANLTKPFKSRKFHNNYRKKLENKNINKINNKDNSDYLEMIYTVKRYMDASSILQKSGYKTYYLNRETTFTKNDINQLFSIIDDTSKYYLFCNLLISKKYCDIVVNNKELLIMMKNILKENTEVFRYLFGYAWLKLYFDESIKKSNLKIKDDCIFDINTVAELPNYPFSHSYPKFNPYMPIMVDDDVLNPLDNINGLLESYKINETCNDRICNLEEFRKRLNLFAIGNANANLFADIEWEKMKIAIGGSIMSACIQKSHPLMNLFHEDGDNKFIRFFNEYYCKADIDIMFLTSDIFDYMDNIKKFHYQIIVNTCNICAPYAEPNHIKLKPNFQINFCVKDTWIIKNLVKEGRSFEHIYNKRDEQEIKDLFFPVLEEELGKMLEKKFQDTSKEDLDKLKNDYPDYFLKAEEYDYKIHIFGTANKFNKVDTNKKEVDTNKKEVDTNKKEETTYQKPELEIKINYKYSITSPHFNHALEMFMNKTDDHMSLVSQFHLPCVRGFYNGENVYMTPSCISAHMTLMNIDYKYFAGSKDPIEIVNKNRMRGFGTWLNENEIKNFVKYSGEVDYWNNLYGVDKVNPDQSKIRGCLNYDNKLVHPRLINADKFYDAPPVNLDNGYKQVNKGTAYSTKDQLNFALVNMYNSNNGSKIHISKLILSEFQVINKDGSINPLQKWVIEAFYESKKRLI